MNKNNLNFIYKKKFTIFKNLTKHGAIIYDKKLFLFGGKMGKSISQKIIQFDMISKQFTLCSFKLSQKKYNFAFIQLPKGKVFIFGGKDEKGKPLIDIELIDFKNKRTKIV